MIVGYNVPRAIFIEKVKRDRKEIAKRSLVWYGKNVVLYFNNIFICKRSVSLILKASSLNSISNYSPVRCFCSINKSSKKNVVSKKMKIFGCTSWGK